MSFVPGSEPRDFWLVLGGTAALVGSLQWLVRREIGQPGRIVSRCADGSSIGEWGGGVRRRPGRRPVLRFRWPGALPKSGGAGFPNAREDLAPGDLAFIRIREGGAGEAAWVVEGLDPGPEAFRIQWGFASADPALVAYRLLEARIADPPRDAAGRVVTLGEREFDALWSRGEGDDIPPPDGAQPLLNSQRLAHRVNA